MSENTLTLSIKQKWFDLIKEEEGDPLLVLSFDSFKNKSAFMRRFEFDVHQKFIKGEVFGEMIERID